MRVAVTGATGFIGSVLVEVLRARGLEVLPLTRKASTTVAGALTVHSYIDSPMADVLVHLAEQSDVAAAKEAGEAYVAECVRSAKALVGKGFRRVVYASSSAVYTDESTSPRRTMDPVQSESAYSRAKLAVEAVIAQANGVSARLANVYGRGMSRRNVIADILSQVPLAGPVRLRDTSVVRDFISVIDVAECLAAMVERNVSGIFNVGSGVGISIAALARTVLRLAGQPSREVVSTMPSACSSFVILDIDETALALGWRPRVGLKAGLRDLLKETN